MRTRVLISFNVGRANRSLAVQLVEPIGCLVGLRKADGFLAGYFSYWFDADDARVDHLRARLSDVGVDWSERREYVYDDTDLRSAPLLVFRVSTRERDTKDQKPDRFDFSAGCPRCGTGAHQVAPLVIPARALPKKASICQTLDGYYLVTEPLRQALANAEVSGLELRQVISTKGEPLAWWQMGASFEMLPMNEDTRQRLRGRPQDGCPECGRDNFFDGGSQVGERQFEQVPFAYDRSRLGEAPLPDVVRTYECLGISAFAVNAYLALPRILVKPKVMDIFWRLKIRPAYFEPVVILDQ